MTNWAEGEAGLRRRDSLTLWITPKALAGWAAPRRKTRGGQPLYSDLTIETTPMLGMVFGLRLRQSEGLLSSVLDMMGLDLPVPDHTTLSRRPKTWKPSVGGSDRQHVEDGPIHLLVDSSEIIAHSLADQETGDASQLEPLLEHFRGSCADSDD